MAFTDYVYTGNMYTDNATTGSSSTVLINTLNTSLMYATGTTEGIEGNVGPSDKFYGSNPKKYMVRKQKKIKGDKTGAQDPSKRLSLGATVLFKIIKKKLSDMELTRLNRSLEQIAVVMENIPRNQIALTEDFEKKLLRTLREAEMASCGFNKFIEHKTLNNFVKSCKNKVIKITKIKNYVRFIPKSVRDKMAKAEAKGLFDDYVVVHTDPNDTSVKKTELEKKDPILFGVISESDHFYFISDWEDELCNLTLDTIIQKLGLSSEDYTMDKNFGDVFKKAIN